MIGQDVKLQRKGAYYDFVIDDLGNPLMIEIGSTETADILSFFGKQRASPSDLPDLVRRNGWLGNLILYDGFEYGSKAWLYYNNRLNDRIASKIQDQITKAFSWQVSERLFKNITVETEINYEESSLYVFITKIEQDNKQINRNFTIYFNNS